MLFGYCTDCGETCDTLTGHCPGALVYIEGYRITPTHQEPQTAEEMESA